MNKFEVFCRSFYKNVICKRKFKAFFILCCTPSGRAELNALWELVKDKKSIEIRYIDYRLIDKGHRIVYRDYELSLVHKKNIPPIKVVAKGDRYVIVDGNHRYLALMLATTLTHREIKCEVMI